MSLYCLRLRVPPIGSFRSQLPGLTDFAFMALRSKPGVIPVHCLLMRSLLGRSSKSATIVCGSLHKVANGYCSHHATGVGYPTWRVAHSVSFGSTESAVQRSGTSRLPTH